MLYVPYRKKLRSARAFPKSRPMVAGGSVRGSSKSSFVRGSRTRASLPKAATLNSKIARVLKDIDVQSRVEKATMAKNPEGAWKKMLSSSTKINEKVATNNVAPFLTGMTAQAIMRHAERYLRPSTSTSPPERLEFKMGSATGAVSGRPVVAKVLSYVFTHSQDQILRQCVKNYPSTRLTVTKQAASEDGKVYFNSPVNHKTICKWNKNPNSPALDWGDITSTYPSERYPLSWNTPDDERCLLYDPNLMPFMEASLTTSSNTPLYAVSSKHMRFQYFNTNSYLPVQMKVYLCRAKTLHPDLLQPAKAYFSDDDTVTLINADYIKTQLTDTTTISGQTLIKESAVSLTAYPAMSQLFQLHWDIVKVDKIELQPLETLNIAMDFHPRSCLDVATVMAGKTDINTQLVNPEFPYALMVEFQGMESLIIPRIEDPENPENAIDGVPQLVAAAPARVRFKYKKFATVHYPVVQGKETITTTMSSAFARSTKTAAFEERIYYQYDEMSDENGAAGTFYIPVFSDQTRQVAAPLAKNN